MEPHQLERTSPHVAHEIAGADAIIVLSDDFESFYILDLISRDNHRSEAEKRVDALAPCQVSRILAQDVERGEIHRSGIAEDDAANIPGGYEFAGFADDYPQFALRVHIVGDVLGW